MNGPVEMVRLAMVAVLRIYAAKSVNGVMITPIPKLMTIGSVDAGTVTEFER